MTVVKIDMAFPSPTIGIGISPKQANEGLITVGIYDPISLSLFAIRFHVYHPSLSVAP